MGKFIVTDEVGSEPSVAEPSSGSTPEEVHPVRREVPLHRGREDVVVPGIDARVPEHQDTCYVVLRGQLPQLGDIDSSSGSFSHGRWSQGQCQEEKKKQDSHCSSQQRIETSELISSVRCP